MNREQAKELLIIEKEKEFPDTHAESNCSIPEYVIQAVIEAYNKGVSEYAMEELYRLSEQLRMYDDNVLIGGPTYGQKCTCKPPESGPNFAVSYTIDQNCPLHGYYPQNKS